MCVVTCWNTRYETAIIDRLERDGHPVSPIARAHISPARFAHINQHGPLPIHCQAGGAAADAAGTVSRSARPDGD